MGAHPTIPTAGNTRVLGGSSAAVRTQERRSVRIRATTARRGLERSAATSHWRVDGRERESTEGSISRRYPQAVEVEFLGGAREIDRGAILLDDRLLLDFGMDSGNPPQFPIGSVDPDAVVASHGRLDHAGSIPSLLSGDARPPIHWKPSTRDLATVLSRDTLELHGGSYDCPFTEAELARVSEVARTHGYGEPFEAASYEVTSFDAGHVPGSAHVLVSEGRSPSGNRTQSDDDDGETHLLYTGDFHTEQQRLLSRTIARPDADVVLCESTYADTSRPPREEIERAFIDSVRSTIWEGGTVVVPAFAIGRTQEVLCILAEHDVECYVDGTGKRVTELFLRPRNRRFLRDPDLLRRAKENARFVDGRDGQRERIAARNTVIVTSGMLGNEDSLAVAS